MFSLSPQMAAALAARAKDDDSVAKGSALVADVIHPDGTVIKSYAPAGTSGATTTTVTVEH